MKTVDPFIYTFARDLLTNTDESFVTSLAQQFQMAYEGALDQIEEYLSDRSDEGDLGHLTVMGASKR